MTDTDIDIHNPIFKTLHRIYTKCQYILPTTSFLLSPSHPTIPTLKPLQHSINMETSTLQMFRCPPHEKDNTNTLVEKTKNSRSK
jgi:hypothetical protein